jgi:hypothetical protein
MGSAAGMYIRFHLQATHTLSDEVLAGLIELQQEEFGVGEMQALANIHGAFHAAAAAVNESDTGLSLCTSCGIRKAVVILTTDKLCRPCALIAGERIGREN